ncbi:hypothetical protein AB1P65_06305 [Roseibium alexandrii]
MKTKLIVLSVAIGIAGHAYADPDVPGKFMQDGATASAVTSAISLVHKDCLVPLDFEENDRPYPQDSEQPDTAQKADVFLTVTCNENEDGTTGGIGIAFSEHENELYPEYFYSFP